MTKKKLSDFTGAALVFCFSLFSSPSHSTEICFVNSSGVNIEGVWFAASGVGYVESGTEPIGGILRPGGNTACISLAPRQTWQPPQQVRGIYRVLGPNGEVLPMISQYPVPNGPMYDTWGTKRDNPNALWVADQMPGPIAVGNGAISISSPSPGVLDVYLGGWDRASGWPDPFKLPKFVGMGLGVYGQFEVFLNAPEKGGDGVYRLNIISLPTNPDPFLGVGLGGDGPN